MEAIKVMVEMLISIITIYTLNEVMRERHDKSVRVYPLIIDISLNCYGFCVSKIDEEMCLCVCVCVCVCVYMYVCTHMQ